MLYPIMPVGVVAGKAMTDGGWKEKKQVDKKRSTNEQTAEKRDKAAADTTSLQRKACVPHQGDGVPGRGGRRLGLPVGAAGHPFFAWLAPVDVAVD